MEDPTFGGGPERAPSPSLAPEPLNADMDGEQARAPSGGDAKAAGSLADQAKRTLTDTLDGQKGAAADMVGKLAETVQHSGERFQGRQDWIASAVGRGAAELRTLADSLRDKDLGELARDVQFFAQRRPALFIGAAVAVGFVAARLGKVVTGDLSRDDLPTIPEVGHGHA